MSGKLHGFESIYREPGVNRSLKPEDDDKSNLNITKYRYQVNKAALATENIIRSVKAPDISAKAIDKDSRADAEERQGKNTITRRKFVEGVAGTVVCHTCFSFNCLAAVCGTYCGACPAYIAKHSTDEGIKIRLQKRFASGRQDNPKGSIFFFPVVL